MKWMTQWVVRKQKKGKGEFFFPLLFVLLILLMDWMIPTHIRKGDLYFTESIDSYANLIQKYSYKHIKK